MPKVRAPVIFFATTKGLPDNDDDEEDGPLLVDTHAAGDSQLVSPRRNCHGSWQVLHLTNGLAAPDGSSAGL